LYSEKLIEDFTEKNRGFYTDRVLSQLKMSDLFINSNNLPNFVNNPLNPDMNLMNNFSQNLGYNNIDNRNFPRQLNLQYNNNNIAFQPEPNLANNNILFSNFESSKKNNIEFNNHPFKSSNDILNKDIKNPSQNKIQMKPFVTNSTVSSVNNINNNNEKNSKKDFLNKARRRSIKNNKIVFVHSLNGAARKIVNDPKVSINN